MTSILKTIVALAVIAAFALTPACKKKEEGGETATETTETAPEPTDTETAAVEPEITDEEIPVSEDFEDESEKEITEENFEAELDKLAGEIEAG